MNTAVVYAGSLSSISGSKSQSRSELPLEESVSDYQSEGGRFNCSFNKSYKSHINDSFSMSRLIRDNCSVSRAAGHNGFNGSINRTAIDMK